MERSADEVLKHLETASSLLDDLFDEYFQILDAISHDRAVHAVFDNPAEVTAADEANLYNSIYLLIAGKRIKPGIHVISRDGDLVLSTQPAPPEYDPLKYENWGVLRKARNAAGQAVMYPGGIHNRTGSREIASLAKIAETGGNNYFFVIVDLFKGHIESVLDSFGNGKTITVEVTDRNLIPLYARENEIAPERFSLLGELLRKDTAYEIHVSNGQPSILAHYVSPRSGLHIFGLQPLRDILSGTSIGRTSFLIIGLGTALLCFLLASLIAHNFSEPLYRIIRSVLKIRDGDLTHRIVNTRRDEIGLLADSINEMSGRIETLVENNKNKERSLRIAELEALQAQIHPHFLFNCLDLIKWNARMGRTEEVSGIVLELGRFLRASIRNGDELIPLEDEIRMIRDYLGIQKRRFEDRLETEIRADDAILKIMVPKFMLQPIVENSLVHGLEGKTGAGQIRISAVREGDDLVYTISDNGVGMDAETLARVLSDGDAEGESGIGLRNVRRRLVLYYGEAQSFTIETEPGRGTLVRIRTSLYIKEQP